MVSKRPQSPAPDRVSTLVQSRQANITAVVSFGREVPAAELDEPTSGNRIIFYVLAERFEPVR